ncbi:helix-turn-helix transcriptional regulator [Streptomyces sp. R302]|uniref:TrmB family transcriptional regulator n=1 Tax=unclassified Streptomyces TaxID=2593676 RepID=UPI00145F2BC9|nr:MULTISPECIES: helix-turn-helix transcriptional regulator [unclassified Streptomyces]NML55600.1 helix-turn-helix transcriptional regulator [Streptomyces sp. R301]NML79689.1 helix-turn-helix transcriptional regulator [Streptomyces sp. R302]
MDRMQFLGVTPAEEETYRHLLRHPGSSVEDVVAARWQPRGAGADVVRRLKDLGAVVEDDGALWPEKPELVVGRLAERLLTELHTITRGLAQVYPMVRSLQDEAAAGRRSEEVDAPAEDGRTVERITDAAALRARVEELALGARSEVLAGGLCEETGLGPPWVTVRLCLGMLERGVTVRLLVWRSALDAPAVVAQLRRLAGAGARVRVLPSSEGPMVVYDGRTVLVPVVPSDIGKGAFVTGEPGMVNMVVNHFERLWADAREFGGG